MNTYLSYKLKVLSLIAIIFVVFIHANINISDSTNFLYENSASPIPPSSAIFQITF